jgi:hypothetical protein
MSSSFSSLGVRKNPGMVVLGVVVVEAGPRGEELPAVAAGVGHGPGEVEALHMLQQVVAPLLQSGGWRISTVFIVPVLRIRIRDLVHV